MRDRNNGLIINITSILGYFGIPFRGVYCATKSSLEIIGEVFSMELKKFNIINIFFISFNITSTYLFHDNWYKI